MVSAVSRVVSLWRVCGFCRPLLIERGAMPRPGPHEIELGHACDACDEVGALQATHVLEVDPSMGSAWLSDVRSRPLAPLEALDESADAPLVAQIAGGLLHGEDASAGAIAHAVVTARRIVRAARGK